jgi:hypothetical protein
VRAVVDASAHPAVLAALLEGLTAASAILIRRLGIPPLYHSGVRYQREPRGRERWQLAPETYDRGVGDCEDLATWRAAELRLEGVAARPLVYRAGPRQLHVIVATEHGYEDPSRVLGMGKK